MRSIFKIGLGATIVIMIVWFLPIDEILELFLWIVMVPIVLMAALGMMSQGTYELIRTNSKDIAKDLTDKIKSYRDQLIAEATS